MMRQVSEPRLWWSAMVGFLLGGAVIAAFPASSSLGTSEYLPRRFEAGSGQRVGATLKVGPVDVVVLEATRLDEETVGLHLVVSTDNLRRGEELAVDAGLSGFVEVRGKGGIKDPPQVVAEVTGGVAEVWTSFEPGVERFSLDVAALNETNPRNHHRASSRGQMRSSDCAVPLNAFRRCGTYRNEGRLLATLRLDMRKLHVHESIWR